MNFFIETVNKELLKELQGRGLVDGVVVNGRELTSLDEEIGQGIEVVFVRIGGDQGADLVKQAQEVAVILPKVIVVFPLTKASLAAIHQLQALDIKTAVTGITSLTQGLMVIKAGVTYMCPYLGESESIASHHLTFLWKLRQLVDFYGYSVAVMADIRHISQLADVSMQGADSVVIPEGLVSELWSECQVGELLRGCRE